jgi:ferrochelatase
VYDAVLIVSFGGPEGPGDVMPFLENVTRGREVPRERLLEVAAHYQRFGGVSPINAEVRRLVAAVEALLQRDGPALPVYWGNRNWHPLLAEALKRMADDGVSRALAFVTSAFSSYAGCRQYLDDIAAARAIVGPSAPLVEKLRVFFNHPGFIDAMVARTEDAVKGLSEPHLVFTAHSIPQSMAASSDYEVQIADASQLIAERVGGGRPWSLAYQSRSGPPMQPWLQPDVSDHLDALAVDGVESVVVVPVGFVSDHMEVVYDLDVVAAERAAAAGLTMRRAATAGDHPAFVAMIRDLLMERIAPSDVLPRALGDLGVRPACAEGCCPPG